MKQTKKDFLWQLAIVVISAMLSFLLSYVEQFNTPIEAAVAGGAFATIGGSIKQLIRMS